MSQNLYKVTKWWWHQWKSYWNNLYIYTHITIIISEPFSRFNREINRITRRTYHRGGPLLSYWILWQRLKSRSWRYRCSLYQIFYEYSKTSLNTFSWSYMESNLTETQQEGLITVVKSKLNTQSCELDPLKGTFWDLLLFNNNLDQWTNRCPTYSYKIGICYKTMFW